MPSYSFDRAPLVSLIAHAGTGNIMSARVRERIANSNINFVDMVIVPPGTSIGLHRHNGSDEEIYIVIDGRGQIQIDGDSRAISAGDVHINRPGHTHGLINDSTKPIQLVVIDVSTNGSTYVVPSNVQD